MQKRLLSLADAGLSTFARNMNVYAVLGFLRNIFKRAVESNQVVNAGRHVGESYSLINRFGFGKTLGSRKKNRRICQLFLRRAPLCAERHSLSKTPVVPNQHRVVVTSTLYVGPVPVRVYAVEAAG